MDNERELVPDPRPAMFQALIQQHAMRIAYGLFPVRFVERQPEPEAADHG